jgi:cysteinyl-tRNA synthetase
VNPEKRHPNDFALWKKAEPGHLMRWKSPWGEGFPGWHIECSAMSMKYLGETFDIHGGGLDNIFPHHECEIAQSEALTGKPFARYWLHNNMVTVSGEKMSKSQGNFITVKDALKKYDAATLRYFILSSHYRSRLDISDEALEAAKNGIEKLTDTIRRTSEESERASEVKNFQPPFDPAQYRNEFEKMMDDDFNTPRAMAVLFDFSKQVNSYLNSDSRHDKIYLRSIREVFENLAGEVLGIIPPDLMKSAGLEMGENIEKVLEVVIDIRNDLRDQKLYDMADRIRSALREAGILLVDKAEGTSYQVESK